MADRKSSAHSWHDISCDLSQRQFEVRAALRCAGLMTWTSRRLSKRSQQHEMDNCAALELVLQERDPSRGAGGWPPMLPFCTRPYNVWSWPCCLHLLAIISLHAASNAFCAPACLEASVQAEVRPSHFEERLVDMHSIIPYQTESDDEIPAKGRGGGNGGAAPSTQAECVCT